jgi:hypothetical protein
VPAPKQFERTTSWSPPDEAFVAVLAGVVSLVAWSIYFRRGDVLLYGDAVAHIGIARRVVDSLTPGLGQLGTVWLPLPHLLMLPFVASLGWWRAGGGASLPAMFGYIASAAGIYRMASRHLAPRRIAVAWFATLAFAANPNLLYLQATAMTEPLYLALFVWATYWLAEYVHPNPDSARSPLTGHRLVLCGLALFAAELTRYDGWFAAPFFVAVAVVLWFRRAQQLSRGAMIAFILIVLAGPAAWVGWNWRATGNPLDFANGPYSARGIEQRVKSTVDARAHPGEGEPLIAARYFIGTAQLNLGEKRWGRALFWLAALGAFLIVIRPAAKRNRPAAEADASTHLLGESTTPRTLLLLWLPLPFYTYSVAYGSVPIFTPMWWPYSYYNVRYGIELLPAIALGGAALLAVAFERTARATTRALVAVLAFAFVAGAYQSCWFQQPNRPKSLLPGEPWLGPIAWREAVVNSRTRIPYERRLAHDLRLLPRIFAPGDDNYMPRLLMFTGDHIGALQRAGIPLARVINEGNYGSWQRALAQPAGAADYIVAAEGDAVAEAVRRRPEALEEVTRIVLPGQPRTAIYRSLLRRRALPIPAQRARR